MTRSEETDSTLPFAAVVDASMAVTESSARSAKRDRLAALLERAGSDIGVVVGYLVGVPRQGRIGVGYATVSSVQVEPAMDGSLTVGDVDACIDALAACVGPGSNLARSRLLADLFERATAAEQTFLRRLFTGELRQGALDGVMADAIARAADVPATLVRRAAMFSGDLGLVAETAIGEGRAGLERIGLEVLRPILPMLASTADSVEVVVGAATDPVSVEWKLDGVRIQVHRRGDRVEVFTRNLNRVTERLPAVTRLVGELDVEAVILDGEAMALAGDGDARPFEQTMSRFGADEAPDARSLVPFFFDILHLDGADLIDRPFGERRQVLEAILPDHAVPAIVTADPDRARTFFDETVAAGTEGVMVKDPASPYQAGRRGKAWRKVKPVHTLDLLVLAAEWGHGRRTGWLSNLHLGALDSETGEYVMLGKTFKGLTDEMLAWQTERLLELEERRTGTTVFVRPGLVAEIALDGLLPSPRYPAGMALRFARVKTHRPDKTPAEVDTLNTVRVLYERRTRPDRPAR